MKDFVSQSIGQSLSNLQAALKESGESLNHFLKEKYIDRWSHDNIYHIMSIRTTLVNSMHNFLAKKGLLNMERVSLSPLTDPLAHDVEHVPTIQYKGHFYQTTHSMIYSKFLACFNPKVKGIFVDSPNIRLELESPSGKKRNKYVIDFSQMDIELRRNRGIQIDEYKKSPDKIKKILKEDFEKALDFFEDLIIDAMSSIVDRNEENLNGLEIAMEVPQKPFPRYRKDEAVARFSASDYEKELGKISKSQFFWITGLMRENYDLIYPYLMPDGSKKAISEFTSDMIYNYDMCAQSINRKSNIYGAAYEILSGAVREWLFEPIVERLLDNRVIPEAPIIADGNIENIEELGGYGPFLLAVSQKDKNGNSIFPDTLGGGIGIERTLFALCLGEKIQKLDEVMLFGKDPDSYPLYLF